MIEPVLDFEGLTSEQRLRLIELLWESLGDAQDKVPLTSAQRDELDRRLDDLDLEQDRPVGLTWEEVARQARAPRRV